MCLNINSNNQLHKLKKNAHKIIVSGIPHESNSKGENLCSSTVLPCTTCQPLQRCLGYSPASVHYLTWGALRVCPWGGIVAL